jgi:shikimate dehydrogenase
MNVSGKTAVYGVIGDPIVHTLSPAMQNAAFEAAGLDAAFLAFHVPTGGAESAVRGMRSLGIRGLNVTMPHKDAVLPFLDEADETAQVLGSANTIFNESGRLRGFNTDGAGAHRALEESGVVLAGKKLVLIGAGGAAKAVAYTLAREVSELVILNRTASKTEALAQIINEKFRKKVTLASLSPEDIQKSLRDAAILVNATAVGMRPHQKESLVKRAWLRPGLTVMDIVYDPVETQLAKDAKAAGAQVISGLEMLLHQGAASFEIWTGRTAPVAVMRQALLKEVKSGSR